MNRLSISLLLLVLLGCAPDERDDAPETDEVPIGPGTDSTSLLPPDTPVSRRETRSSDTLPPPITTR
jgi:hypothetical protein